MKAIVYTGPGWIWCDRVKSLLEDNNYEIDERPVRDNMEVLYTLNNNEYIRSIPQVVIDGSLVGGFAEVESKIKGLQSINKIRLK